MRIRAEDLLKEDAIKPNILDAVRDLERKVARMQRAKKIEANVGDRSAPHNVLSPERNLVTVAQEGGDFQTITDALISIEDASGRNPYTIEVYPGIYDEQVVMKPHVALVGLDRDICRITHKDSPATLIMASDSSVHELEIINEFNGTPTNCMAIKAFGVDRIRIDHCDALCQTSNAQTSSIGLGLSESSQIWVRGSDLGGWANTGTWVAGVAIWDAAIFYELKLESTEAWGYTDGSLTAYGVRLLPTAGVTDILVYILHGYAWAFSDNGTAFGIHAVGDGVRSCVVYVNNEKIVVEGDASSRCLYAKNSTIYIRAVEYDSWQVATGGQIIPLAGDRPRLECVHDTTSFVLTAGAAAWENDPTGTLNIDLPCESDLKVDVAILWYSDQVRTTSFRARVDLDGAVQSGTLGYAGEPVINQRMIYSLSVCFAGVATGTHTLTIQVSRNNVADGITVFARQMTVMSDPWP